MQTAMLSKIFARTINARNSRYRAKEREAREIVISKKLVREEFVAQPSISIGVLLIFVSYEDIDSRMKDSRGSR